MHVVYTLSIHVYYIGVNLDVFSSALGFIGVSHPTRNVKSNDDDYDDDDDDDKLIMYSDGFGK